VLTSKNTKEKADQNLSSNSSGNELDIEDAYCDIDSMVKYFKNYCAYNDEYEDKTDYLNIRNSSMADYNSYDYNPDDDNCPFDANSFALAVWGDDGSEPDEDESEQFDLMLERQTEKLKELKHDLKKGRKQDRQQDTEAELKGPRLKKTSLRSKRFRSRRH
jgi:hypothetical protein